MKLAPVVGTVVSVLATAGMGCGDDADDTQCGPSASTVRRVIDGDTVELTDGTRVRYLLIDAPEIGSSPECFGPEATTQNEALVLGRDVSLEYDQECNDRFDRLLAYVFVSDRMVNEVMVQRGFARVAVIAPNDFYEARLRVAEQEARTAGAGLWSSCP
ncbi:MAG: thermonuclease family protein [Myxococcota bacterium]